MCCFPVSSAIQHEVLDRLPIQVDHDYGDTPSYVELSRYVENAIVYIAGFVVRNIVKNITCEQCIAALTGNRGTTENNLLLDTKDRGGLVNPSSDTVRICAEADKCFRRISTDKPPNGCGFSHLLVTTTVKNIIMQTEPLFPNLTEHQFDTEPNDNHVTLLVQRIAKEYIKIRLYHWGKQHTSSITGPKVRKELSKLILFKNQ